MKVAKTKYMSLGTDTNYLEVDNGDIITGSTEYKYLGSIRTKDGRDTKNIRHRVTQALKIIGVLNGIEWSKDITKHRKKDDL
jgi:predicted ATP-grasp superfamily ATP-dependent carboligase